MKKFIFLLLFLLPISTFPQFSDNFSDGLFQNVPGKNRPVEWIGDVEKFMVNEALQLQLNAPAASSPAQLRTQSALSANAYWECWMKLDFNPTASNYAKVYLCSDADDLTDQLNGLFVRVGYTNKRELRDDEQGSTDPGTDPGTGGNPDPNLELPVGGDVIFSEIMANPGGSDPEYIELYNASNKYFNLKNCLYYYGDKAYKLPDGVVNPYEYFVLSKTTTVGAFSAGAKVFGVTSFPTLANTGKLLMFTDDAGGLISWFEYTDKMYRDNDKKGGGWSLECIDFENKGNTAANWIASSVQGGSPGRENTAKNTNPDTERPTVTGTQAVENNGLLITFSKPMDRNTLSEIHSYTVSHPQYSITGLQANYPYGTELTIQLSALPSKGDLIELTLDGVRDLSGFAPEDKQVLVGSGHEATAGEIVINEILFNPPTGGNEYVEVYNNSDKAFDLRFLSITSRKPSDGSLNKAYPLASTPLLLNPEEYLVITKSRDLVCTFFDCRSGSFFTELSVMPSLANASGCAVLLNNQTNEVIDEFAYNEKMHAEGISNKKGISLERLDFNRPSSDPENWHSASSGSGFGTPGYQNSQTSTQTGTREGITVDYPSVDIGNYAIHYQLNAPGYRCRVYVYDSMGRIANTVSNNELLGTEGTLVWNGKGSSGQKLLPGIYIVYMEVYDMKGSVKKFRKPTVVK